MKKRAGVQRVRTLVRAVLIYAGIPYLFLVVLFAAMQRSMIYFPTRVESIKPEHARLPAGRVRAIAMETDDGLLLGGWHFPAEDRAAVEGKSLRSPHDKPSPPGRGQGEGEEAKGRAVVEGRPGGTSVLSVHSQSASLPDDAMLVLFFPGNAGDRRHRKLDGLDLADLGLDVLLFDYRGYGDNPGSPSEEKLAADAHSVWRYAIRTRGVPPERIILYGESIGGAVATRLAAELSESGTPPAALVLCATFSSLADAGAWHYPWLPVRLLLLDRYPSTARVASVTCPVLQIHGTADRIVPLDLARKLHAATPEESAGGIEKRFVELPDKGHNDIGVAEFREAVRELLESIQNASRE